MFVDLNQNTSEWLNFRHQGIGASDIPVIMGVSKYKRKKQLFAEKIKDKPPVSKSTYITNLGHRCEKQMRPIVELSEGMICAPVLVVNDECDYLRASLDGFDKDQNIVWECKMTGRDKFYFLKGGKIPDDFLVQVQYQLYVTNCSVAKLTAVLFNMKKGFDLMNYVTVTINAHRDIQKQILDEAHKFWRDVVRVRKNTI